MILGDFSQHPLMGTGFTLDALFRQTALLRPDAPALIDAPNRTDFVDGEPRRLTYAQCERVISAIAARLQESGLPRDGVVGIQLANQVEYILTILGVLRAGMIAAPLPLLWRRADCAAALAAVDAKALITSTRIGKSDHGLLAMEVAAEVFSIRRVYAFGSNVPDGIAALDDVFDAGQHESFSPLRGTESDPGAHVAVVTWERGLSGLVPVARNHLELLAAGLSVLQAKRVPQNATMLSTLLPESLAGLSLSLLPFMLAAGALVLHHGFDRTAFVRQMQDEAPKVLMLPGGIAPLMAEAGLIGASVKTLFAAWRMPERLAAAPVWRKPDIAFVDVAIFSEIGLLAACRDEDGRAIPFAHAASLEAKEKKPSIRAQWERLKNGTLALRGAMVPRFAFPPGAERGRAPHFKVAEGGFADTGYPCKVDKLTQTMIVTGSPTGFITIGGYRFNGYELQTLMRKCPGDATVMALPDRFCGQRLAGNARDKAAVRTALEQLGVNPLVIAAFRDYEHVAANR